MTTATESIELIAKNFIPGSDVRPTDGSPYYSHNLHRYLKQNPDYNHVYAGTWNSLDGHNPDKKILYIGRFYEGSFIGIPLLRVLCLHKGRFPLSEYSAAQFHTEEWEDITEHFTALYQQYGRCALHDFDHQWDLSDDALDAAPFGTTRKCRCCGAVDEKTKVVTYTMKNTRSRPNVI